MDEYILPEIKQLAGIYESDDAFDGHIVLYANGVFAELNQMHAGPPEGFSLSRDSMNVWRDFTSDVNLLSLVKTYVVTKVQLRFNTPASSVVVQEMHAILDETAARILNITDRPETVEEENQNGDVVL